MEGGWQDSTEAADGYNAHRDSGLRRRKRRKSIGGVGTTPDTGQVSTGKTTSMSTGAQRGLGKC
jgi:hypothetical protein